ncbi:11005_t:CDS:2 [Paraglomus occultum]|uniref:11005_t:CDS:1 n=1 Tax=Paraglomus occultum TaxID=144539 RepID=A0A9N9GF39_9GLOM|nr:11005_t:CDS:2 [Paraglomus occultum]
MNYPTSISLQTLKSQLDIFEKTLLVKQKVANQDYFKQLIKVELGKLLKSLPKGVKKIEKAIFIQAVETNNKTLPTSTKSLQDTQNLKQSLTDGEAKTLTSNLIEQKLGGSEKFQEGVYQAKPEIVKSVLEELKAKGTILKEIHNIFGPDEFYPTEPSDSIPKGREGFRKNAKELALQQAEEQAQIKAIEA